MRLRWEWDGLLVTLALLAVIALYRHRWIDVVWPDLFLVGLFLNISITAAHKGRMPVYRGGPTSNSQTHFATRKFYWRGDWIKLPWGWGKASPGDILIVCGIWIGYFRILWAFSGH